MIYSSETKKPHIHESAYVAPTAVLSGDVTIGAGCAILHGAVITAEGAAVEIGPECVVMENAVLKAVDKALKIGEHSVIAPHAYVVDTTLPEDSYVPLGGSSGTNVRAHDTQEYAKFLCKVHAQDASLEDHKRATKAPVTPEPPPKPIPEVEGVDSAMMVELQEMEHRRQEALRKQREHK